MATAVSSLIILPNHRNYEPFKAVYQDLGHDTIQIDVTGRGVHNFEKLDAETELEIHTNILTSLRCYSQVTDHSASEIAYDLTLLPVDRNRGRRNPHELDVELCIIFKKPIEGASAYSLEPTITLITSSMLEEIFIL